MNRLPPPELPRWIEEMVPFERYALEVENHRVHVMESGTGRPVLALHGNPTWGFLYRRVAKALFGESFRLIMPDLIGLGWSSRPPTPAAHTLDNHGRWIARVVEALEIEDWILVGQDWGGPIGLLAARRVPNSPGGLVLLNTVVGPPRPGFRSTAFHAFSRMPIVSDVAFRVLGFPQVALWAAQGDRRSIRGRVARAYRAPLRSLRGNAAPLALARMVPDSMEHPSIEPLHLAQEFFEGFDGPMAGVWGEEDPILGGVARWVEKLRPDIRMVYTNAGHFPQEEVPGPIGDAIRYVDARL